jgi:putative ABC transport system permease protein
MSKIQRAFRNVWRRKTRSALVIAALALVACTIVAVNMGVEATKARTGEMVEEYQSHISEMENLTKSQANQLTVTAGMSGMGGMGMRPPEMGGSSASSVSNITYDVVENISSMELVEEVVPIASKQEMNMSAFQNREAQRDQWRNPTSHPQPGQMGLGFTDMINYTVYGVPLNLSDECNSQILPSTIIEGRVLSPSDSGCAIINESLKTFFKAGIGDTINISGIELEIVGIYDGSSKNVYMNITDARKILGLEEGACTSLIVYATNESSVDLVASDIEDMYSDLRATSSTMMGAMSANMMQSYESQIETLDADLAQAESTGNQVISISVIGVGAAILFVMLYAVKERTKEIGTLKAMGFGKGSIMSQFMMEGIIMSVAGGAIGIVAAIIAAPYLSTAILKSATVTYADLDFRFLLMAFGIIVGIGAVGSLYPAYQASRKSPMEAIRHE